MTAGQVHSFKSLKSYVMYQFQCKEIEKDTYTQNDLSGSVRGHTNTTVKYVINLYV